MRVEDFHLNSRRDSVIFEALMQERATFQLLEGAQ